MTSRPRLALVGDRSDRVPAHAKFDELVPHFGVEVDWLPSAAVTDAVAGYDGIWVIPGSPYVSQAGALLAIRTARTAGIPYLGTCGGFQHALIEYSRNVLGIRDAEDVQYDADATTPLIVPLACSLVGETAPLHFAADSRLASVYPGRESAVETYHCKYGLNPAYENELRSGQLGSAAGTRRRRRGLSNCPATPSSSAPCSSPNCPPHRPTSTRSSGPFWRPSACAPGCGNAARWLWGSEPDRCH